jgi:hypothetical protein
MCGAINQGDFIMQTASFDLVGLLALISVGVAVTLSAISAFQQHLSSRKQSITIFGPVAVSRVTAIRKRGIAAQETRTERLAA